MGYYPHDTYRQDADIDISGVAGDTIFLFAPVVPIKVVRWGFISRVSAASGASFGLDRRILIGDDTGRLALWGGKITTNVATAQGEGAQHTLIEGEGARGVRGQPEGMVIPGEELIVDMLVTGGGSAAAQFFIEYEALAGQGRDILATYGGIMTEYAE